MSKFKMQNKFIKILIQIKLNLSLIFRLFKERPMINKYQLYKLKNINQIKKKLKPVRKNINCIIKWKS